VRRAPLPAVPTAVASPAGLRSASPLNPTGSPRQAFWQSPSKHKAGFVTADQLLLCAPARTPCCRARLSANKAPACQDGTGQGTGCVPAVGARARRSPAHCIEYAHLIQWDQERPGEAFDADVEEHLRWVFDKAAARAAHYGIQALPPHVGPGRLPVPCAVAPPLRRQTVGHSPDARLRPSCSVRRRAVPGMTPLTLAQAPAPQAA